MYVILGAKDPRTSTFGALSAAREPGRLTVFRMSTDGTPVQLVEHAWDAAFSGQPLDVEFCRPQGQGSVARLAISFTDPISDSAEGVVRVYAALTPTHTDLNLLSEITGAYECRHHVSPLLTVQNSVQDRLQLIFYQYLYL